MLLETKRININEVTPEQVDEIIEIESDEENRWNLWVGTVDEHNAEILDPNHLLLIFKDKYENKTVGYALIRLDFKSKVFEVRRIAITKKHQGYGEEAMGGLLKFAFEEKDFNRVWLDVYPHNLAGIKLYEKLGMYREGVHREAYKCEKFGYLDQIIYSMLRKEYYGGKN